MGLLRLILAIGVILGHTGGINGYTPLSSNLAVQVFYIISGFYMALILNENYTGVKSTKTFYLNRALKIYPIYWTVIILKIAYSIYAYKKGYYDEFDNYLKFWPLSFKTIIFLIVTNIIIIGIDLYFFMSIKGGDLYFDKNGMHRDNKVYNLAFNGLAWTVSLELIFYLFAPILTRLKARWIILILIISLLIRILLIHNGYEGSPWNYMFLPAQVMFFMAGIISYKIYRRLNDKGFNNHMIMATAAAIVFAFCLGYYSLGPESYLKQIVLFIVVTAATPFIFKYTRSLRYDRWLGNLSYPVYISQALFIGPFHAKALQNPLGLGLSVVLVTIAFGIGLEYLIMRPIEKYRIKRKLALKG